MASSRRICAFLPALLLAPLHGQEPGGPLPSLQELLRSRVTVASRKAEEARESPGVVTVLTREEILASGARDLIDLLRLVPGFDFGSDVQGQVGASLRGLWAYEGKLLLLWDGVELNEQLYGETPLGGHYPVDQIRRVEIIRGPGSVMYGDTAELAVIKVTTLQAEDLPTMGAGFTYGQGTAGTQRRAFQAVLGRPGEDWSLRAGAYVGAAQRSQGVYTDALGESYGMDGQNLIQPRFLNLGLEVGDLQLAAILDQHRLEQRDNQGENLPAASGIGFRATNLQARYAWAIRPNLLVTPTLTWLSQKPWWTEVLVPTAFTQFSTERRKGTLDLLWDPDASLSISGGLLARSDSVESRSADNTILLPGGALEVTDRAWAVYAEVQSHGSLNLTLGGRYERHSASGGAFAPRLALTHVAGPWHVKVLSARSYRAPTGLIQSQRFDPALPVAPETSRTHEVEVGRTLGPGLLSLNAFDLVLDRPIIFVSGPANGGNGGFLNQGRLASRGLEAQYQARWQGGFLNLGLAFHRARETGDFYGVAGEPTRFLGAPNRALTLAAGRHLGEAWTVGTTLAWRSERFGWIYDPGAGGLALRRLPDRLLVGAQVAFRRGALSASLAVQNALDQAPPFVQAYDGGHAPLPGPGREWVVKLRHGF